jgi:hypothetical protein
MDSRKLVDADLIEAFHGELPLITGERQDAQADLRGYLERHGVGSLEKEIARDGNIGLINLRGEIAAAKEKGLSFRENLLGGYESFRPGRNHHQQTTRFP